MSQPEMEMDFSNSQIFPEFVSSQDFNVDSQLAVKAATFFDEINSQQLDNISLFSKSQNSQSQKSQSQKSSSQRAKHSSNDSQPSSGQLRRQSISPELPFWNAPHSFANSQHEQFHEEKLQHKNVNSQYHQSDQYSSQFYDFNYNLYPDQSSNKRKHCHDSLSGLLPSSQQLVGSNNFTVLKNGSPPEQQEAVDALLNLASNSLISSPKYSSSTKSRVSCQQQNYLNTCNSNNDFVNGKRNAFHNTPTSSKGFKSQRGDNQAKQIIRSSSKPINLSTKPSAFKRTRTSSISSTCASSMSHYDSDLSSNDSEIFDLNGSNSTTETMKNMFMVKQRPVEVKREHVSNIVYQENKNNGTFDIEGPQLFSNDGTSLAILYEPSQAIATQRRPSSTASISSLLSNPDEFKTQDKRERNRQAAKRLRDKKRSEKNECEGEIEQWTAKVEKKRQIVADLENEIAYYRENLRKAKIIMPDTQVDNGPKQ